LIFHAFFPELLTLNFIRDEHAMFIVAQAEAEEAEEESEEAAEEQEQKADERVLK